MDDNIKPYDRRPDESPKAFEAFSTYRDMGTERSHDKVRIKLGKKTGYLRQIEEWSSQFEWVKRIEAWDKEIDKIVQETSKMKEVDRRKEAIERHISLSNHLQSLGYKALQKHVKKLDALPENDNNAHIHIKYAITLINQGIAIEREALDIENQKKLDITSAGEKITTNQINLEVLSYDELKLLEGLLTKAGAEGGTTETS